MFEIQVLSRDAGGRYRNESTISETTNHSDLYEKMKKAAANGGTLIQFKDGQCSMANFEQATGVAARTMGVFSKQEVVDNLKKRFPGVSFVVLYNPVDGTCLGVLLPTTTITSVDHYSVLANRLSAKPFHLSVGTAADMLVFGGAPDVDIEIHVGDLTVDELVFHCPWAPDDTKSDECPLGTAFHHRLPNEEAAPGVFSNRTLYSYGCSLVRDEDACSEENYLKTAELFGDMCVECDVSVDDANLLWDNIISFHNNVLYPRDAR